MAQSSHKPVKDGQCASCHNPHKSANKNLLVAAPGPLCLSCHKDIELAAKSEHGHAPAREGQCATCHVAHSANQPALLTQPVAPLCMTCHDGTDPKFQTAHLNEAAASMNCALCHDAHGSKEAGLFMPNQHTPFQGKQCDVCHVPQTGGEKK
jgi:predicted CXXCH cytochrome family protein